MEYYNIVANANAKKNVKVKMVNTIDIVVIN